MLSIILLAFVQGIAEFLPISSSFHLIIFRDIFMVGKNIITPNMGLAFDIALHFGTALSVIVFFFKDFLNIFIKGITKNKSKEGKMLWYIVLSTIPASFFGVLFEDRIDTIFRTNFYLMSFAFIIMGIILYLVDKYSNNNKDLNSMSFKEALIIGIYQVFALIPGFSRSGVSITSARLLGINREDSSIYSFYLSLPIVLGAVILSIFKIDLNILKEYALVFTLGVVVSFITGLLSIRYLLNYVKKNDYKIFLWYRIIIGIMLLILIKNR